MQTGKSFPDRVTLQPDGVYRWTGKFGKEARTRIAKMIMNIMSVICLGIVLLLVFFILYRFLGLHRDPGAILYAREELLEVVFPVLGCLLFVLGLAGLFTYLFYLSGKDVFQPYEMTDEYVHYVSGGRADTYIRFKSVRRVRFLQEEGMFILKGGILVVHVAVPREDIGHVKVFLLKHLPENAVVTYQ